VLLIDGTYLQLCVAYIPLDLDAVRLRALTRDFRLIERIAARRLQPRVHDRGEWRWDTRRTEEGLFEPAVRLIRPWMVVPRVVG
jgi:hypothetical protein